MRDLLHSGQFAGHKSVVLGAGSSGLAAAKLLRRLGAEVSLLEKNPDNAGATVRQTAIEHGFQLRVGEHSPEDFAGAGLVVLSPGIPKAKLEKFLAACPGAHVVAEMELASWFVTEPMAVVTGTNGKTTTVMLISHILSGAGFSVFTGGNIGTPLSEYVLSVETAQILVLEASSFQLQNVASFKPAVGALLNFSANHLDWHADMDEYLDAKLRLFAKMDAQATAILPEDMRETLANRDFTRARQIYFKPEGRFTCGRLLGEHNQANMEAAWQVCRAFGVELETAKKLISDFAPPSHRLQAVGEKRGVGFVDDSKATTVEALRAAILSFKQPVRLLCGGVFKGGDLAALVPDMLGKVKAVGLFGQSREIFEAAWADKLPVFWEPDMRRAMTRLYADAEPGDVILLSPATSSFDLYTDYKARGRDFQTIFAELEGAPTTGAEQREGR